MRAMKASSTLVRLVVLLACLLPACGAPREAPRLPTEPSLGAPAVTSAAPSLSATSGPPQLLVVSALNGYIEPCGCTVDLTLGGIDKTVAWVEAARARGPTAVLIVGSTLFDPHVNDAHLAQQESAKAAVLAKALKRIGVDAWTPTATELKYGADVYFTALGGVKLPDVTVNVGGGRPRLITLGDAQIGVFGLANAEAGTTPSGHPGPAEQSAREASLALRTQGAQVVVGLATMPRRALRTLARRVPEVDLWVLGENAGEEPQLLPAGPPDALSGARPGYIIEAGDRGRHVAQLVLHDLDQAGPLRDPSGDRDRELRALEAKLKMQRDLFTRSGDAGLAARIAALEAEFGSLTSLPLERSGRRVEYALVPINKAMTGAPEVTTWLADYNQQLKAINLASVAPVPPLAEGASGFSGGEACAACHEEAVAVWRATPHARAWETLVKVDKTFDAECVSCHVTGWLAPGGVNLANLKGMTDVQCEACHGPSALHVDSGGEESLTRRTSPAEVCTTCHNKFHSPKFDYATYLPKVLGPGHQARQAP